MAKHKHRNREPSPDNRNNMNNNNNMNNINNMNNNPFGIVLFN